MFTRKLSIWFILLFALSVTAVLLLAAITDKPLEIVNTTLNQTVNTPVLSEDATNTLYYLREGAIYTSHQGIETQLSDAAISYSYLFGLTSDGTLLVGNGVTQTAPESVIPPMTLHISEFRPSTHTVLWEKSFENIQDVYYQSALSRFVLFHASRETSDGESLWTTAVSVVDRFGAVTKEFTEPNLFSTVMLDGGTHTVDELVDGTLLLLKKDDNSNKRFSVALLPSGANEERESIVPTNADNFVFFHDKVYGLMGGDATNPSSFVAVQPDGSTALFLQKNNFFGLERIVERNGIYILGKLSPVETRARCSTLVKRENANRTMNVIGDAAFVLPGVGETWVYGEPIDSCDHVRVWETDLEGKNARLLVSDVQLTYAFQKPIVAEESNN